MTAARIVFSSSQSQRVLSSSAYWKQPRKTAISNSPIRSKPRSSEKSGLSMSIVNHTTAATERPGTMLTRNNQCQEKLSVRKPPTVGPMVPDRSPAQKRGDLVVEEITHWIGERRLIPGDKPPKETALQEL